jgi:hypothetical protein
VQKVNFAKNKKGQVLWCVAITQRKGGIFAHRRSRSSIDN